MLFSYLACQFGKSTLSNLVKECFGEDFPDIIKKKQINYIYNYLKDLDAKTVLLEAEYVDKDYLEDYSRYYVKCFNRYGERCARLHFFKERLEHTDFDDAFSGEDENNKTKIQESYLGFVVIKPIPKTFIGKTCLKTYDQLQQDHEKNVLTRKYEVNLFGIGLTVETIAFQEQDKVLSACATTAIWSVLHATNKGNIRDIPSSGEITLAAINYIDNSSNTFPNDGLTNKQILRALDTEKLRHHIINVRRNLNKNNSHETTFKIIKTYIDSGIPMILGADVYELNQTNNTFERLDGHAVSILGYRDNNEERALYLHDDRIGPFARARILHGQHYPKQVARVGNDTKWCVALQEKDDSGTWKPFHQILIPDSLIIPTDKKVRIPATYAKNTCREIVDAYNQHILALENDEHDVSELKNKISYSVKLEKLPDVRQRILSDNSIANKRETLTKSSARYLWSARFTYDNKPSFEILFDATDIPQGKAVSNIIIYNEDSYTAATTPLRRVINNGSSPSEPSELSFLGAFMAYLMREKGGHQEFLNKTYGELRAPRYLKDEEVKGGLLHTNDRTIRRYGRKNISLAEDLRWITQEDTAIWAISHDGELLIGKDEEGKGHPTLTGFKPARIAGELKLQHDNTWKINSRSGRYSSNYHNANELLKNAKLRFLEIYAKETEESIIIESPPIL